MVISERKGDDVGEKREAYLKEGLSQILRYGYRYSKAIQIRFDASGLTRED